MANRKEYPVRFTPRGLSDAWDSTDTFSGACLSLENLVFDPSNPELVVSRPGVGNALIDLGNSIPGATFISVEAVIAGVMYGMVNSSLNTGHDQPFAYDILTNSVIAISNITAANTPTSPATTGDWTPPTMSMIGDQIIVTHPGFGGGASNGSFTGVIAGSLLTVSAASGVINIGSNIAGTSVPAGTSITGFVSGIYGGAGVYTINNTASISSEAMTSTGGYFFGVINLANPAAPFWYATNTGVFPLPSVPLAVGNYNNRAYYACANSSYYSDVLLPTNMATAGQALTHGDSSPITGYGGLPIETTSAGVVGALVVFKEFQIWQVTGDAAITGSLSQNYLSLNLGTLSPRSIVQTPIGMVFISISGPYTVSPFGQVLPLTNSQNSLIPDVVKPFQNIATPSRAVAAYTGSIYRVCLSTLINGVSSTGDYWFDITRRRWNGPHTFVYDIADQAGNYFVLASHTLGAKIFVSNYLPQLATTYIDNGTYISFNMQSAGLPKTANMNEKQVVESNIELANINTSQSFFFVAMDETFATFSNAVISANAANYPVTYAVPWPAPLVFKKLSMQISGISGFNIQIGTMSLKYRDCGYAAYYNTLYTKTVPSTPIDVVATPGFQQNTLSWLPSFAATSYNLYWSTTPNLGTGGTLISGVSSPFVQLGLTNGVPYYYVITAVNSYGASPPSAQVTGTPDGVQFQNNSSQDVDWTNNTGGSVDWIV